MPELTFAPKNPVWPPPAYIDPRVTRYPVARISKPGHPPVGESLSDICQHFGVNFDDLIEFNFGLKRSEPHYFEKINWFLKHKLGCRHTTPHGNFIFNGGEIIYIPQLGVSFDPVDVSAVSKEGRISRYVTFEENVVEPRDPEGPNPIVMMVSDIIKNWMIEKSTGRKVTPPNQTVAENTTADIPRDSVLTAINIQRTRDDMKPSQFVRAGSYSLKTEVNFVYGPGKPDTKVFVNTVTVWTEASGNVKRITDSQYIDQPSQYQNYP